MLEVVGIVERERGLDFRHPVTVEFLDEADYQDEVGADGEPTDEEREELDHLAGVLRALALVDGDLDLLAAAEELVGEGTVGLYSSEDERIVVRGDELTPAARVTLAHELTHALQDQHFDLDRDLATSGEEFAFSSLVEADADRVAFAYTETFSAAERAEWQESEAEVADGADLEDVPAFLSDYFAASYVLGPAWLEAVIASNGRAALDEAFASPPVSEEQVLLPERFIDGDDVVEVPTPDLGDGEEQVGEDGDFGMLSLLLVLGERLPFEQAWPAVQGWAGDASVGFRRDGRDCIRIHAAFDTPAQTQAFADAAEAWASTHPDADVGDDTDIASLTACDPGAGAGTLGDRPEPSVFEVLSLRAAIIGEVQASGAEPADAACVADDVIDQLGSTAFIELATITEADDPRAQAGLDAGAAAAEACGL